MLWFYLWEWIKVLAGVAVFVVVFILPTWIIAYRQGYEVGRTDGASIARRERERA